MNKFIRLVQNYLVFSIPFVLIIMVWGTLQPESVVVNLPYPSLRGLWEVLSWNLIAWFSVLILFLITMVFTPSIRESTLKRLANLKERDEREQYIVGKAARATYISTLSVMILLLFFSIFTLNITRVPETQAIKGKRGTLSIGLNFKVLDDGKVGKSPEGDVIFESNDIRLSNSAVILVIMLWQLTAFNVSARREARA